jgi:hypothetical protein
MSPIRFHRLLGLLAIVHSGLLLFFFPSASGEAWLNWYHRLWVGLATLWFFWPVILALHPAQSARRVLTPLCIAGLLALLWIRMYADALGPAVFGLPEGGFSLLPHNAVYYGVAYGDGWYDAKRDLRRGRLAYETYGFGGGGYYAEVLKERYQVEQRPVAGCVVSTWQLGHAEGYNRTIEAHIKRRFGHDALQLAQSEASKRYSEAHKP